MSEELSMAIVELKRDEAVQAVRSRLEKGEEPLRILEECRHGMSTVGERFQKGDYFLAELMLSAEIFKEAMNILQPHLARLRPEKPLARVVLATLQGDIHNLGKDIVATLLQAHGFEVHDLGVDVPPSRVLVEVKKVKPRFVGFSALITTAFPSMKEAARMLQEAGLRKNTKLMIGGGVTTPMTRDYVGADFQTLDAMEGVAYCLNVIGGK
ncbi:MAG: cobalamin-dependent protein [Chloroflexi bacterium]|nr:cobalamin-dependent protein [Chloroflexota bacterium]